MTPVVKERTYLPPLSPDLPHVPTHPKNKNSKYMYIYISRVGHSTVGSIYLSIWPVGLGDRRVRVAWLWQACGVSHRAVCWSHPQLFYGLTRPSPPGWSHGTTPGRFPLIHSLSVLDWLVQPKPRWLGGNGWLLDGPEEVLQGTYHGCWVPKSESALPPHQAAHGSLGCWPQTQAGSHGLCRKRARHSLTAGLLPG